MPPNDRQRQMYAATADVIAWQDHGDERARALAIQSVENMVWHHARRAHRRVGRFGVELEDLVGAAREGAVLATDKFDRARGEYAAVASLYIRSCVDEAARRQSGVVTYGTGKRAKDLEINVNRALAEAETAGLTSNQAVTFAAEVAGITEGEALAIARRSHAVSFDQEKHDAGYESETVLEALQDESLARLLDDCLAVLDERETAIVRAHHFEGVPLTEIGPAHGFSAQRAGQIHGLALQKLTREVRRRGLRAEDLL